MWTVVRTRRVAVVPIVLAVVLAACDAQSHGKPQIPVPTLVSSRVFMAPVFSPDGGLVAGRAGMAGTPEGVDFWVRPSGRHWRIDLPPESCCGVEEIVFTPDGRSFVTDTVE